MSENLPKVPTEESKKSENENGLDHTEHELDTENLELLDDRLVEKIQEFGHEDFLIELDGSKANTNDERLNIVEDWFTEKDDYRADTKLEPQQVYALTMLRNMTPMFPNAELDELDSWIHEVITDFERYVVSVEGMGRRQEENVLRSIFGDTAEMGPNERDNFMARMLSNPPENKDE